jgi:hypothetical protein
MPVITALGRQKQIDHDFTASLSYIVRPCLKEEKKKIERSKQYLPTA